MLERLAIDKSLSTWSTLARSTQMSRDSEAGSHRNMVGEGEAASMTKPAKTVFVNYRRRDDAGTAIALQTNLERLLSDAEVFMDTESLKPGEDFVSGLPKKVADSDVVLVVIGMRWMEELQARRDRPVGEVDHVVLEIETALRHNKMVVPVRVGGAEMPEAKLLPKTIQSLARLNQRYRDSIRALPERLHRAGRRTATDIRKRRNRGGGRRPCNCRVTCRSALRVGRRQ